MPVPMISGFTVAGLEQRKVSARELAQTKIGLVATGIGGCELLVDWPLAIQGQPPIGDPGHPLVVQRIINWWFRGSSNVNTRFLFVCFTSGVWWKKVGTKCLRLLHSGQFFWS